MGESQADVYQPVETVEEFTDLFHPGPTQVVTHPTLEAVADPAQAGVSLEEASRLLNLHVDTIKKRLRKGTLKGFKVQEKFGEKWFVSAEELPGPTQAVTDHTLEVVADPIQVVTDHTPEAVGDPIQVVTHPTLEAVADPAQLSPALDRLITSLEKKDAVIESQAYQLKAAGDVIMYLRTQLEEKDTQLKLLTDSQHKAGWWARFYSWMLGKH
jgi:hypothetical protein